jgi:hypothetical protein
LCSLFSSSMVQPTSAILTFDLGFRLYSRQSIISAQPVLHIFSFVPTHYASSTSSSFHSSFHLVCCFDILPRLFWFPVSFPLGVLAAFPIAGSTRSLFVSVLLLSSLQPVEPRHHLLSIGYRRLCLCLCLCHSLALVFPILHQIPVVVRSPDLWLPFRFSVSSLISVSVSLICSVLSSSCSGATWFPLSITVIPISAFLSSLSISGVLAAQPASFVPSLGLFYRRPPPLHPFISFHLD